jgi:hypothetical protein
MNFCTFFKRNLLANGIFPDVISCQLTAFHIYAVWAQTQYIRVGVIFIHMRLNRLLNTHEQDLTFSNLVDIWEQSILKAEEAEVLLLTLRRGTESLTHSCGL